MSIAKKLHELLYNERLGFISWYELDYYGKPARKQIFDSTIKMINEMVNDLPVEDVGVTGYYGMTILHHLVTGNYYTEVKTLLEKGANLNITGGKGENNYADSYIGVTPLHIACYVGNLNMVKLLLSYGADSTIKDRKGRNCFHYLAGMGFGIVNHGDTSKTAAVLQYIEIAKLLQCNINEKDNEGKTPMIYLMGDSQQLSVFLTKHLIDMGADIHIKDADENNLLILAALNNHITATGLIMEYGENVDYQNNNGDTALIMAYKKRNYKIVYMLLKHGANPDLCNNQGENLRHLLKNSDRYEEDELIENIISGKRMRIKNYFNLWSRLDRNFWGRDYDDENVFYFDLGRDIARRIDVDDETEHTYIRKLIENFIDSNRGEFVIKMLLEEGYDMNMIVTEKSHVTTIRDICFIEGFYRDNNGIKELIEAGIDINKALVRGETPAYILVDSVSRDSEEFIFEACIKILENLSVESMECISNNGMSAVHLAAKKFNNPMIIDYMIKRGVNVNVVTDAPQKQGNTPLHIACLNCHVEVVKSLMAAGADDSLTNCDEEIPAYCLFDDYHSYNSKKAMEILKLLDTVNAKRAKTGETPLLRLFRRGGNYEYEMLEIFIDKGVDINCPDNQGNTPLIIQSDRGRDTDVIKLLLREGADINARNEKGNSALMYVVKASNSELARYLIKKGADYNIINLNNETPSSIAVENGLEAVLELMTNITVFPVSDEEYDDDDDYDDYEEERKF